LNWFLSRLKSKEPFTFSRWGDGEWRSVLGRKHGSNCDGHYYTEKLTEDLRGVLASRPKYALGIQKLAMRLYEAEITSWLKINGLLDLVWSNCDVFHYAAIKDELDRLLLALSDRPILMIGPDHLSNIPPGVLDLEAHIVVPDRTAHDSVDMLITAARLVLDSEDESMVVSVCAGMTAEIIVHLLHQSHGDKHTIIDFGSLWDPLVGVQSRTYMRTKKDKS
jgi:hypothetical protein